MMNSLEYYANDLVNRRIGGIQKLTRLASMFKCYRWRQIAFRAKILLVRGLFKNKFVYLKSVGYVRLNTNKSIAALALIIIAERTRHPSSVKCNLAVGSFNLLNTSVCLKANQRIDFSRLRDTPHPWRLQFHCHEYLLASAASGSWDEVGDFLSLWMDEFQTGVASEIDDAWHSYCISRRVVIWVWLLSASGENPPQPFSEILSARILRSLVRQCEHLRKNVEYDPGGSHLLENAAALAIVGASIACEEAGSWADTARSLFENELPNQVHTHGEYYELSPMVHCQVLGNLLCIEACCVEDQRTAEVVKPFITSMFEFLVKIRHPDGEIPLFSDSVFFEAPSVEEILTCAKNNGHQLSCDRKSAGWSAVGHYRLYISKTYHLILDFGEIAAPGLPAHAHCDMFNLELSVEGSRWIVDSGNYNYEDDSMRQYCRASIGHNVVTVNGQNQADIWGKFRMGYRPSVTDTFEGETSGWTWVSAQHNGYKKYGIDRMSRLVATRNDNLMCLDYSIPPLKNGPGKLVGFLHFHPDVSVTRIDLIDTDYSGSDEIRFKISRGEVVRFLSIMAEKASFESGWYCPEFGKRIQSAVIRYEVSELNDLIGWILHTSEKSVVKYGIDSVQFDDDIFPIGNIRGFKPLVA